MSYPCGRFPAEADLYSETGWQFTVQKDVGDNVHWFTAPSLTGIFWVCYPSQFYG